MNGFSSGSSSLLWPLLLAACDVLFGDRESTPLLLNLAASTATVFYAASILRRFSVVGWRSFLVLAAVVVLVPLPAIILSGMEHSVQILVVLAFVDVAAGLLADGAPAGAPARGRGVALLVLGGLMTGIRYEGLFLVGIVACCCCSGSGGGWPWGSAWWRRPRWRCSAGTRCARAGARCPTPFCSRATRTPA